MPTENSTHRGEEEIADGQTRGGHALAVIQRVGAKSGFGEVAQNNGWNAPDERPHRAKQTRHRQIRIAAGGGARQARRSLFLLRLHPEGGSRRRAGTISRRPWRRRWRRHGRWRRRGCWRRGRRGGGSRDGGGDHHGGGGGDGESFLAGWAGYLLAAISQIARDFLPAEGAGELNIAHSKSP